MADIQNLLNNILKAVFGKDVRQSIHDAIKQCYYDGKAGAVDLEARENIELANERIDNLAKLQEGSTTGDAELVDGRVDYNGNTHTNIGTHIREVSSQLSSEIADNTSEIELIHNSQEITEWIEGYRLVESNGDIYAISTDGFFVTKYIPVNGGDIIELSGYVGASGGYPIVVGYPTMFASGERTILLTGYTTATLLKKHKIVIPYENNIRYVRISMREKDNVEISARIIKKTTEKITESNKVPTLKPFPHAENYCIGTPAELGADLDCDQIGLCSVLDIREIPCFNKIDGANLYMWAAPHDGVNSFDANENKSNAGSIYLYYADKPDGEWKLYSTKPVISRVDFQNAVSQNDVNSKYCNSGVNGGKVKINHISSPEVVWDENLDLTQNGVSYHGGFRIYFHASGWKRHGVNGDFVQRTFLAYSVDGKTLHSFESTDLDYPVIPDPLIELGDRGKSSIDATCSDYLRILRHGNGWYAFYNAEPYLDGEHAESSYNVAMSYSHDGKRFMPTTDFLIHGRRDKFNKTGIPCLIERKNRLYIAYTAHDTSISVGESFGDGIYLSEIKPDGSVSYIRELLTENETVSSSEIWDSYRICAPFLLEYDDEIFLFYGGTSKANATEAYERWKNSHIGVTKLNRRFGQVWN